MTAVMMANPAVAAGSLFGWSFSWMVVFSVIAGLAALFAWAKTKTQRMVILVAAAVLTAILITGVERAFADDFPMSSCQVIWWC